MNNRIHMLACFGMPSVFSSRSKTCNVCEDKNGCERESASLLVAFQASIDVSDLIAEYSKSLRGNMPPAAEFNAAPVERKTRVMQAISYEQERCVASQASEAVREKLSTLYRRGEDVAIVAGARTGVNVVNQKKHSYLWGTLDALFSLGKVNKSQLRQHLETSMGWSKATAMARVSLGWQISIALGITSEEGGFLTLCPIDVTDNISHN